MNAERLGDLVARGNGRAALALGGWCDAYRPAGASAPLAAGRRFLRLRAAFVPVDGRMQVLRDVAWTGVFDHAYTRTGDYLRREDGGVWFVASQEPLSPVLCVRTTRVLDFSRPGAAALPGVGAYGGVDRASAAPVLSGWPASVTAGGGGVQAGLPGDVGDARWHVVLPVLPAGVELRPGDLMRDELGRGGVVVSAEASALGWALSGAAGGGLMADQADVEAALVGTVAAALYPDGVAAASAVGAVCRVYRGGRRRPGWMPISRMALSTSACLPTRRGSGRRRGGSRTILARWCRGRRR